MSNEIAANGLEAFEINRGPLNIKLTYDFEDKRKMNSSSGDSNRAIATRILVQMGDSRLIINDLLPPDAKIYEEVCCYEELNANANGIENFINFPQYVKGARRLVPFVSLDHSMAVILHECGHLITDLEKPLTDEEHALVQTMFLIADSGARLHTSHRADIQRLIIDREQSANDFAFDVITQQRKRSLDLEPGLSEQDILTRMEANLNTYRDMINNLSDDGHRANE